MSEFNNMTVVSAAQLLADFHSHADIGLFELEWGIQGRCSDSSKLARVGDIATIAIDEDPEVHTQEGRMPLSRAIIENALSAPQHIRGTPSWIKLLAGLRLDGFEAVEDTETVRSESDWGQPYEQRPIFVLRRMLPDDVPGLDFREAESELIALLDKHHFDVPKGHLTQAQDAFSRGDWASANAQLRSFYEGYLNEIASRLGYHGNGTSQDKRKFLGDVSPPFLLSNYNEPHYVQALMSRSHPGGSHPGLSEEDDCTFRMQITLITARLFLRRFDQRISG